MTRDGPCPICGGSGWVAWVEVVGSRKPGLIAVPAPGPPNLNARPCPECRPRSDDPNPKGTDVAKKKSVNALPSTQAHAESKAKAKRAKGKSPVKVAPPRAPVDVMRKAK